jgi:hypothetical protein
MRSQSQIYPHQVQLAHASEQSFHFPASPHLPAHPQPAAQESEYPVESSIRNTVGWPGVGSPVGYHGHVPQVPHHASELDAHYWKNMFLELGFGENVEGHTMVPMTNRNDSRGIPHYLDSHQQLSHSLQHQGSVSYQHMPDYMH